MEDNNHNSDSDIGSITEPQIAYENYYEHIAHKDELRPIMVTEGVENNTFLSKLAWVIGTAIKMISLIWLSVRTDRFCQPRYLRHHWRHYFVLLVITALGWLPTLWNYMNPIQVDPVVAYVICACCLVYYPLSMTLFMWVIAPRMRAGCGKAWTLKFWEGYISMAWQIQTVGFTVLTFIEVQPFIHSFDHLPDFAAKIVGGVMVLLGFGFKAAAIYMTGYNTYYWYDMVLEIPNAYFVNGGIYSCMGSPTYTVGRFTGFGGAIFMKSVPLFIASVFELILITLYNGCVEQRFVRRMYKEELHEQVVEERKDLLGVA